MSKDDDGNGGGNGDGNTVSPELCDAYRATIVNQIGGLKKDIEKVDSRTWFILTGIVVSILIGILSLAMTIATRG